MTEGNPQSGFRSFLNRVREKGVWWYAKRAPAFVCLSIYSRANRFSRRSVARASWVVPQLRFMVRRTSSQEKRILAIWDFSKDPFTVGDFLVFQELTLVLRIIHSVEKVDMIWLYGPNSFSSDGGLTPDNYHHYLSRLLPLAYVNPHLGSFMLMDSPEMLESYIADNHHRYYIAPPYRDEEKRLVRDYTYYFNYIYKFYEEYGSIPHLSCNSSVVSWARLFIDEVVGQQIPVVVHLRNAKIAPERNAKLDCWLEFFEYCKDKFDVKFIMIGEKNQLDNCFRQLPNVVYSKDFGTTIEQDMALIQASCLYLGTISGPQVMATFSDRPYIIFNVRMVHTKLAPGSQHPFATPLQKLVWKPETKGLLIDEFTKLFSKVDTSQWKEGFNRAVQEARSRLVRRDRTGFVFEGWK